MNIWKLKRNLKERRLDILFSSTSSKPRKILPRLTKELGNEENHEPKRAT